MQKSNNSNKSMSQQTVIPFGLGGRVQYYPVSQRIVINIDDAITSSDEWIRELTAIREATPNDIIHIYINSPGGYLNTTQAFLSAMSQTDAYIITEIVGECASAATFIFLAGHEFRVSDDADFMSHTVSYGAVGSENHIYDKVLHNRKLNNKFMNKYYKHFFEPEEIESILNGTEKHLDAEEVVNRLEKRAKKFAEESNEDETTNNSTVENTDTEEWEYNTAFDASEIVEESDNIEITCDNGEVYFLNLNDDNETWINEYEMTKQDWRFVARELDISFNSKTTVLELVKTIREYLQDSE